MRLHGKFAESGIPSGTGVAVFTFCQCGQLFAGWGETVKQAKKVIGRKHRDHRRFAVAAGPGWTGVGT
jgi:hypothetical protein